MNDAIRTVLFDFDGTLVFHEPDSFEVISAFCAEIGQPLSPEDQRLGRRMRHRYFVNSGIVDLIRNFSGDEFWRHLNRHLLEVMGIEGDLDHLADALSSRLSGMTFTYECPEAGRQTLAALRARGYGLGLLTNRDGVDRFHQVLDQTDLRPYFDLILASGEVDIRKPAPGIFHAALERMGGLAEEALYIGDNYFADIVGAQRAGMTPVLLDPDRLFPEADCLVLSRIDDLLLWLP